MARPQPDCPECCCVLGICCDRMAAKEAYINKAMVDLGVTREVAGAFYDWTDEHFALAPKSVAPLIAEIATMARHQH